MSRKGRNGRSKKNSSQVAKTRSSVSPKPPPVQSDAATQAASRATEPPPPAAKSAPQTPTRTPLAFATTQLDASKPGDDAAASPTNSTPLQDDGSVPPVEFDHAFFDSRGHHTDPHHDEVERDPRLVLKMSAAAAQRRAQLAKYVKGAVALASALCLAALVKVAVAHNEEPPAVRPAVAAVMTTPPATATATVQPAAVPVEPAPKPAEAAPTPADTAPTAPEPTPPPAETAAATATPAPSAAPPADTTPQPAAAPEAAAASPSDAPAATPDPKAAAKEKGTARAALERGALAKSIEAGERSVALDPGDGEAWLILGAAYQQKGDMKDARRCYKACMDQGKRGPKNECAEMLR
jgi:hypothetical protein